MWFLLIRSSQPLLHISPCYCHHTRAYEREGADPGHSVPRPGHAALFSARPLQRKALLYHSSGSEGNLIFPLVSTFVRLSVFVLSIVCLPLLASPHKARHSLIKWPKRTATEKLIPKKTLSQRRRRWRATEHRRRRTTRRIRGLGPRAGWRLTRFRRQPCDPLFLFWCTNTLSDQLLLCAVSLSWWEVQQIKKKKKKNQQWFCGTKFECCYSQLFFLNNFKWASARLELSFGSTGISRTPPVILHL